MLPLGPSPLKSYNVITSPGVRMKSIFLLSLILLPQYSFSLTCAMDPNLTQEQNMARCAEALRRWNQMHEDQRPAPQPPAETGGWCGTDRLMQERSMHEVTRLSRLDNDMRVQHRYNCKKGSSFKACLYYNQYLGEILPHSVDSFCKREGACVTALEAEKKEYSAYLEARVPAKILEVSRSFPLAFIDPILAEDENRAYQEIVKKNPALEPVARREFQHRLCRPEKQKELGSDESECRKFVDKYIEAQSAKNVALSSN